MIYRRSAVLIGILTYGLLGVSACSHKHLGRHTGRAYHQALTQQVNSRADRPGRFDAADARITLFKHRAINGKGNKKSSQSRSKGSISLEKP